MRKSLVIGLLFLPFFATAQTAQDASTPQMESGRPTVPGGFGSQTNVWLAMQLLPAYTDNAPRPIPGEVASRTYSRYLKSFTYPIPLEFERDSFSTNSTSGGSTSSSGTSSSSTSGSGVGEGY